VTGAAIEQEKTGVFRFVPLSRYHRVVDKSLRKFSSIDSMNAEELCYWQGVSARERMQAVWDITLETYRLKGGLRGIDSFPAPHCSRRW
jgi:hypothetical protein